MPDEFDDLVGDVEGAATGVEEEETLPDPAAMLDYEGRDEREGTVPASTEEAEEEKPADDDARGTESGDKDEADADDSSPDLDPDLVARAQALGFSEEDVKAFGQDGQLERVVGLVESRTVKPDEKPAEEEKEPFKLDLDPELVAPEIVDQFEKMKSHFESEIAALQKGSQATQAQLAEQRLDDQINWFDDKIAALGPEWEATFGKGREADLDPKSEVYKNRSALAKRLGSIGSEEGQSGSADDLFQEALNSKFGNQQDRQARKKISDQLSKRKRQHIRRPTQRGPAQKATTPTQRAEAKVGAMLVELGGDEGDDTV